MKPIETWYKCSQCDGMYEDKGDAIRCCEKGYLD